MIIDKNYESLNVQLIYMPYSIRKVRNKSCYKVYNSKTKRIYAKCSKYADARKQLRLLRAVQNNPKFRNTLKNSTRKNRSKSKSK